MPRKTKFTVFFYTYVLRSLKDGKFYMGYTTDINKRLEEHNNGLNQSTKSRKPFILIYCEICRNKLDAINREDYLKSSKGSKFVAKRLSNYLYPKD